MSEKKEGHTTVRETIGATCDLCGAVIEIDSVWDTAKIRRHFADEHKATA